MMDRVRRRWSVGSVQLHMVPASVWAVCGGGKRRTTDGSSCHSISRHIFFLETLSRNPYDLCTDGLRRRIYRILILKIRIKNGGRERAQAQTQRRQTITAITIHHRTTSHLCAMQHLARTSNSAMIGYRTI
jgi:hypothetical protein